MERLERFETMLTDVQQTYGRITNRMASLAAEGKTKTVTYRELMGQKLLYRNLLELYRSHGLLKEGETI